MATPLTVRGRIAYRTLLHKTLHREVLLPCGAVPLAYRDVAGARLLSDVKEGDVIVSAKVTKGLENLVVPKVAATASAE